MNIIKQTFNFRTNDGETISTISWIPENISPKAIIQIVHGMAEYANRYDHFARFLCDNGFAVYANDHRGHGYTLHNSKVGFFAKKDGWECVVNDLKKLNSIIKEKHQNIPIIMFGHSMGSFMARTFAIDFGRNIDALILCGTAFDPGKKANIGIALSKILGFLVKPYTKSHLLNYLTFGNYNKTYKPRYSKFDFISRDQNVVKKYTNDPLCGLICSNSFFGDLLTGLKYINSSKNIKRMPLDLPIFIISGEADPVGNYGDGVKKVSELFIQCGYKNTTLKLYPEARHELVNEINKEEVYYDILRWIEKIKIVS